MQKLVTHFSLRLGLELSGKENCIGFHPILSDCKRRKCAEFGWILTLKPSKTNYLIQKKEPIARLLQGGESAGARTRDPNIKSVVLYLLSYGFSEYQISYLVVQR